MPSATTPGQSGPRSDGDEGVLFNCNFIYIISSDMKFNGMNFNGTSLSDINFNGITFW